MKNQWNSQKRSNTDRYGCACLAIPGGREKKNQFKDRLGYMESLRAASLGYIK